MILRVLLLSGLLLSIAAPGQGFQEPQAAGEETHAAEDAEHGAEESHEEGGLVEIVARLINFGILVGLVMYVAKSPVATYLTERRDQLRGDLVRAAQMRKTANEQLAEIDQRLAALPGELEALKSQGAEEIVAEESRIAKAAELERERLLEQTRRELDLQVRIARDDLRARAAELATDIARKRITERMTPAEQDRLVDRYVRQLGPSEERA